MPGNEWALVASPPLLKSPLSQQEKPFSHRGRAVTKTERDVERMKEKERRTASSVAFLLSWSFSFESFDVRARCACGAMVFPSFLCHRVVFIVLRECSML